MSLADDVHAELNELEMHAKNNAVGDDVPKEIEPGPAAAPDAVNDAVTDVSDEALFGTGWQEMWRVYSAEDKNGKQDPFVYVRATHSHNEDVKIEEAGTYRFESWTYASGIGPRKVRSHLVLKDAQGEEIFSHDLKASQTKKKETHTFTVVGGNLPAVLHVKLSTSALFKAVRAHAVVVRKVAAENADYAVVPFDESSLTSEQRRKLQLARDRWPPLDGVCTSSRTYDHSMALNELNRESEWKTKAFDQGVMRLFLLLCSMHPDIRIKWAGQLGINLTASPEFGDAHAESWRIINQRGVGMQSRVSGPITSRSSLTYIEMMQEAMDFVRQQATNATKDASKEEKKRLAAEEKAAHANETKSEKKERKAREQAEKDRSKREESRSVKKADEEALKESEKKLEKSRTQEKKDLLSRAECVSRNPNDQEQLDLEEAFIALLLAESINETLEDETFVASVLETNEGGLTQALFRRHGWRNERIISFLTVQSFAARARKIDFLEEEVRGKQSKKISALNKASLVVPLILVATGPFVVVSATMFFVNTFRVTQRRMPALILGILLGVLSQRVWLDLGDVVPSLGECYPEDAVATERERVAKLDKTKVKETRQGGSESSGIDDVITRANERAGSPNA